MSEALDDVFGWELLQLGIWGPRDSLVVGLSDATTRRCRKQTFPNSADADVGARLSQLPIANGAVDAVVLPHTLEFETDPYAVVREADRVLAGEGQLVVLGFRPFSLWGFRSRAISRGYPPGLKRMLGARRIADWLELLGYDVVADAQLSIHAALGRQRAASGRALGAAAPGLDQAVARGRVPHQGAQARVHADARSVRKPRERAQPIGGLVKPTTRAELLS